MNSVSGLLQRVHGLFAFAGAIGSVRKKNINDGQRQLRQLKAQIDELSRRLRTIEAMAGTVAVEFCGRGPFCLPLLARIKALVAEMENQLVMVFESQDGREIYAKISYLSAAKLVNGDVHLPLPNVNMTDSHSIGCEGVPAFRLPLLPRYDGHFHADPNTRVMVFRTQEGQRVFFPVSLETYRTLLRRFEATLVAHEWP